MLNLAECTRGYVEVLGEHVSVSQRGFFGFGGVELYSHDYDQQVA